MIRLDPYVLGAPVVEVGRWLMEEGAGTSIADATGRGYTLTAYNMDASNWVAGIAPGSTYALDFGGGASAEYLSGTADSSFHFADPGYDLPFSVCAWVNMDDATKFRIVGKDDTGKSEWLFTTTASDQLALYIFSDGSDVQNRIAYSAAITAYQGTTIHVAATYDGSESGTGMILYINGSAVSSTAASNGSYDYMGDYGAALAIGTDIRIGDYANGRIDDVRIFNKILSATEIGETYSGAM